MEINLELYRIFYSVSNNKNISKAADELHISQPAISKAIKNLEDQLGGTLFVRTKRGVVLTNEGQELYNYIKSAMDYIYSGQNKFNQLINLETGKIKIGITSTLIKHFLLPYLKKFNELYPHIDIEIVNLISSELFPKLRNGLIDLIILNVSNVNYGNDIEITNCALVHDCFAASKEWASKIPQPISISDLNNYPLILLSNKANSLNNLKEFLSSIGVTLNPHIEANYSLIQEFVKEGLGVGFLTKEYIQDDIDNGKLQIIKTKEAIPPRYVGIALCKYNVPNFACQKLIDMILTY